MTFGSIRRKLLMAALLPLLVGAGRCASSGATAGLSSSVTLDLSGEWTVSAPTRETITLQQTGTKLSGMVGQGPGALPITGSTKGQSVSFSYFRRSGGVEGKPIQCLFSGKADSDAGTVTGHISMGSESGSVAWTMTRVR